jgi:hypothetical protein
MKKSFFINPAVYGIGEHGLTNLLTERHIISIITHHD